jgi:hypothetical protein
MSWQARLPPALNDLLIRIGVSPAECVRADGRFTIEVADCGSVDLVPVVGQRVVLDAAIAPVASDIETRRTQVRHVLQYAASRMLGSAEIAALSEDGESFRLQMHLDAALTPVQVEDAMSDYLNRVECWRAVLSGSKARSFPGARHLY